MNKYQLIDLELPSTTKWLNMNLMEYPDSESPGNKFYFGEAGIHDADKGPYSFLYYKSYLDEAYWDVSKILVPSYSLGTDLYFGADTIATTAEREDYKTGDDLKGGLVFNKYTLFEIPKYDDGSFGDYWTFREYKTLNKKFEYDFNKDKTNEYLFNKLFYDENGVMSKIYYPHIKSADDTFWAIQFLDYRHNVDLRYGNAGQSETWKTFTEYGLTSSAVKSVFVDKNVRCNEDKEYIDGQQWLGMFVDANKLSLRISDYVLDKSKYGYVELGAESGRTFIKSTDLISASQYDASTVANAELRIPQFKDWEELFYYCDIDLDITWAEDEDLTDFLLLDLVPAYAEANNITYYNHYNLLSTLKSLSGFKNWKVYIAQTVKIKLTSKFNKNKIIYIPLEFDQIMNSKSIFGLNYWFPKYSNYLNLTATVPFVISNDGCKTNIYHYNDEGHGLIDVSLLNSNTAAHPITNISGCETAYPDLYNKYHVEWNESFFKSIINSAGNAIDTTKIPSQYRYSQLISCSLTCGLTKYEYPIELLLWSRFARNLTGEELAKYASFHYYGQENTTLEKEYDYIQDNDLLDNLEDLKTDTNVNPAWYNFYSDSSKTQYDSSSSYYNATVYYKDYVPFEYMIDVISKKTNKKQILQYLYEAKWYAFCTEVYNGYKGLISCDEFVNDPFKIIQYRHSSDTDIVFNGRFLFEMAFTPLIPPQAIITLASTQMNIRPIYNIWQKKFEAHGPHIPRRHTSDHNGQEFVYYDFTDRDKSPLTTHPKQKLVNFHLPSGNLWASYNLGAEEIYDSGLVYMSGKIKHIYKVKDNTDYYLYGDDNQTPLKDWLSDLSINDNINEYDACTQSLGKNWTLPTKEDWKELFDNVNYINIVEHKITFKDKEKALVQPNNIKDPENDYKPLDENKEDYITLLEFIKETEIGRVKTFTKLYLPVFFWNHQYLGYSEKNGATKPYSGFGISPIQIAINPMNKTPEYFMRLDSNYTISNTHLYVRETTETGQKIYFKRIGGKNDNDYGESILYPTITNKTEAFNKFVKNTIYRGFIRPIYNPKVSGISNATLIQWGYNPSASNFDLKTVIEAHKTELDEFDVIDTEEKDLKQYKFRSIFPYEDHATNWKQIKITNIEHSNWKGLYTPVKNPKSGAARSETKTTYTKWVDLGLNSGVIWSRYNIIYNDAESINNRIEIKTFDTTEDLISALENPGDNKSIYFNHINTTDISTPIESITNYSGVDVTDDKDFIRSYSNQKYRLPTRSEFLELINICDTYETIYTNDNGNTRFNIIKLISKVNNEFIIIISKYDLVSGSYGYVKENIVSYRVGSLYKSASTSTTLTGWEPYADTTFNKNNILYKFGGYGLVQAILVDGKKSQDWKDEHPEESGGDEPGGDTPGGDTPGGDEPGGDTPGGDTPGGDTPGGGDEPGGDTPGGDEPGGDEPGGDTPGGDDTPGGGGSSSGPSHTHIDYTDYESHLDEIEDLTTKEISSADIYNKYKFNFIQNCAMELFVRGIDNHKKDADSFAKECIKFAVMLANSIGFDDKDILEATAKSETNTTNMIAEPIVNINNLLKNIGIELMGNLNNIGKTLTDCVNSFD